MMPKQICTPALFGLLSLALWPGFSRADSERHYFTLRPNRCVALHQGQVCYQNVLFRWKELDAQFNYCIVEAGGAQPLHCWLGGRAGQFQYDFASDKTTRFLLQREDGVTIDEQELVVAWVYKSKRNRNSGWRLF